MNVIRTSRRRVRFATLKRYDEFILEDPGPPYRKLDGWSYGPGASWRQLSFFESRFIMPDTLVYRVLD